MKRTNIHLVVTIYLYSTHSIEQLHYLTCGLYSLSHRDLKFCTKRFNLTYYVIVHPTAHGLSGVEGFRMVMM